MKVLVTGPSGAVGQYVLEALMRTDHQVRVFALPDSMHRINYRDRIEMAPGELADPAALYDALKDVELVFHTALISPPPAIDAEILDHVNVEGTRSLVNACRGKVSRLVMMSSNNVYVPHRTPDLWPLTDDAPREAHGNPAQQALGESLIRAEDIVFEAAETGAFDYAMLRPTIVSGRKSPFVENLITQLIRNAEAAESLRRMWDTMQWTHGVDIGSAALLAAEHPDLRNQRMLVASDEPITAYDVVSLMWEIMNVGRDDNPYAEIASQNNVGLPKFYPARLRAAGWSARMTAKDCIREVLGRLEFYHSTAANFPAYLQVE
ncbi:NAD-dependent epimerase/dehydratase family protein [Ruegeria profundi]|uniref:NAD-dependent dehydratase n=1 Tax=Ruegeria profundi TaxID=1685378 RepID=A0A0X3TWI6_9RHOB|nr:NAD(P)-dependent oxidoreductase [Ruegeria profundi]KUJ80067.1 NAD-dependent dehydratase [Ruegeria profundi]